MVLDAFCKFFGCVGAQPVLSLPAPSEPCLCASSFGDAVLKIYDPHSDSSVLKNEPSRFEDLRNNYNLRREMSAFDVKIV